MPLRIDAPIKHRRVGDPANGPHVGLYDRGVHDACRSPERLGEFAEIGPVEVEIALLRDDDGIVPPLDARRVRERPAHVEEVLEDKGKTGGLAFNVTAVSGDRVLEHVRDPVSSQSGQLRGERVRIPRPEQVAQHVFIA
jgi:hypothetical protein